MASGAQTQKILTLKDVSILTVISNFGVRWLAVAAGLGASATLFWIVGALMLAIPLAVMSGCLSKLYPEEGGIYAWTRRSLGEESGFIVSWLYFLNNVLYYPAVLIFLATNFAFFLGNPSLANNSVFICTVVLAAFWLLVLISIFGLKTNKIMAEFGGLIGSLIPAALIIVMGFYLFFSTHHSATPLTWAAFSDANWTKRLANLTMIMFAMTGVEIIPTFANAVKNPKRDLYFGLIIGALVMIVLYILGTLAINFVIGSTDIQKAAGLMDAFALLFAKFHMPWLTPVIAFMLCFAELAVVSIWLIAPITMFFKCSPKGVLPEWFHRLNKHDAPVNALVFVGFLVTVILLATNLLPAINDVYQILILMSVLLTFIPYLFLLVSYIKNIKNLSGYRFFHWFFSVTVFVSIMLGIAFSFQLPANIKTLGEKVFYESELALGPVIFILLGYLFYRLRVRHVD